MPIIRHINMPNGKGEIYCCLRNRVVNLDEEQKATYCSGCKMRGSGAHGSGVECVWDDLRDVRDPHIVTEPYREWKSNQSKQVQLGPQSFGTLPGAFLAAPM